MATDSLAPSYGSKILEAGVKRATELLEEYLEVHGLTAPVALEAMMWARPGPVLHPETIGPADLDRLNEISTAELARLREGGQPDDALRHEAGAILLAVTSVTEARREAKLAALLTVNGTRHPDPWAWLKPRMQDHVDPQYPAWIALDLLAAAAEHASRAPEALQLGDRIVFPGALISSVYHRGGGFDRLRAELAKQGELFAVDDDTVRVLEAGAEAVVERTQLGNLPPGEVRALAAVFRIFSSLRDDKREYARHRLCVPSRLFYRAGEVLPDNGRACRDLFLAADALAARVVYVALKVRHERGVGVVGEQTPMFKLRPMWSARPEGRRPRSEREAERIAHAWAARGTNPDALHAIPLPDHYELELPDIIRKIWHRLVIGGDVLRRLDTGAKAVRGERESFSGLDWRLFVEITQRTQANKPSDDGRTLRSYVCRDELLEDYYGPATIQKARDTGKFHGKYVAQYEKAVAVLEHGALAKRVKAGHHRRTGGDLLDVFEPVPDCLLGVQDRAEVALERQDRRRQLRAPRRSRKRSPKA